MKTLTELSRTELLNIILSNEGRHIHYDSICECAACGEDNPDAIFYICDKCDESLKEE